MYEADPPAKVYPPLSVVVTLTFEVAVPFVVTDTEAPVIVPHAVPLYDA